MKNWKLSIGNDIAQFTDLAINVKHLKNRFLSKILSLEEAKYLKTTRSPERFIWIIWTIKEATYKCLKCENNSIRFVPSEMKIHFSFEEIELYENGNEEIIETKGFGEFKCIDCSVEFKEYEVFTKSLLFNEYSLTVACNDHQYFERLYWGVKYTKEGEMTESEQLRLFVLNNMRKNLKIPRTFKSEFRSNQDNRPELFVENIKQEVMISFSHDTNYLAYVYGI